MAGAGALRLGRHVFERDRLLVMAIVNRTKDSFYDRGATFDLDRALERVRQVVAEGADIVDIGGVKAGAGDEVDEAEEVRRVVPLVEAVVAEHPDVCVSVDTWRAGVGEEVCRAGAVLLNDAWGGWDPALKHVAAAHDVGYVCTHTGGARPRSRPHRPHYDDVVAAAVADTVRLAEEAVAAGVARESVLVDPAHDFEKTTFHSLELTRRLDELVATGWPVLVALSNKDFVGETLGVGLEDRVPGTLAATAVSAWQGARVFRAHQVAQTRQVLDMVASIRGERPPTHAVRGLSD